MFKKHQLVHNKKKNIDASIVEVFPNNVAICEWNKNGHKFVSATSTDSLEIITDRKKLISLLSRNPSLIQGIDDPNEEMQLTAVNYKAHLIQYIKSPTTEVQMTAVRYDRSTLKFIENPTAEVVILAMGYGEDALGLVKNPTEELLVAVIKHFSFRVIAYVNEMSVDVQKRIAGSYPDSIRYMKNPPREVIEATRKKRLKSKYKHD